MKRLSSAVDKTRADPSIRRLDAFTLRYGYPFVTPKPRPAPRENPVLAHPAIQRILRRRRSATINELKSALRKLEDGPMDEETIRFYRQIAVQFRQRTGLPWPVGAYGQAALQ